MGGAPGATGGVHRWRSANLFTTPVITRWTRHTTRGIMAAGNHLAAQPTGSMTSPPNRPLPPPDTGFEFELTDFASARETLDNTSLEWAAESARPNDPAEWAKRRRPPVPTDRALAGPTIDWMLRLPAAVQPRQLADKFPRLANQIAAAWFDPTRCESALQALLTDERGGRRGLAYELRREVEVLQQHLAARRG